MSLPHARRTRYRLLAWVVPLCFLAVVTRLVWLHWVDAPRLRAEALQARRVLQEKPCRRGDIRDAQDNLLAVSEDVWDIGVDPDVLTKADRERAADLGVQIVDVEEHCRGQGGLAGLQRQQPGRAGAGQGQQPAQHAASPRKKALHGAVDAGASCVRQPMAQQRASRSVQSVQAELQALLGSPPAPREATHRRWTPTPISAWISPRREPPPC